VRGDRIVLRSRRLDREVIPRLTTAHNYRLRSLGVYRFLCALASQGVELTSWAWGTLASAPFLPRVKLGRVVVARAMWNLDDKDLAGITKAVRAAAKSGGLTAANRAAILAAVGELRTARRLPRYVVIAMGDNELPIDLENPVLGQVFADELSGAGGATVLELFPAPDRLVVTGPEGGFANELVLTFTRNRKHTATAPLVGARAVQRSFAPGSGWLYAKIYCGESTADRVLRDAIAPVVREALARGDITQWFFIRYHDPEAHLRVRFCGDPARLVASVLPALERALAPLFAIGAARKLVIDTYDREIERYGGDRGIELAERIFWRDSEAVLGIVELLDGDAGADARWRLTLRGIESLFTALGIDPAGRAKLSGDAKENLGREHRATTPFWTRIGDRFTRERASLEHLFTPDAERDAAHDLSPGFELIAARDAALADTVTELRTRDAAGELTPRLEGFAWSLAHMHANRLIHASHRAHELVLYDFLRRLHAAQKARQRPA
jgi:thiopeptide-type bacteriocin biosynthesis protein